MKFTIQPQNWGWKSVSVLADTPVYYCLSPNTASVDSNLSIAAKMSNFRIIMVFDMTSADDGFVYFFAYLANWQWLVG